MVSKHFKYTTVIRKAHVIPSSSELNLPNMVHVETILIGLAEQIKTFSEELIGRKK